MTNTWRWSILGTFLILATVSAFQLTKLRFTFDFEQFFPKGDPDLEFFHDFIESFETDDNFLLVGLRREGGAFDRDFLEKVHRLALEARGLPHVVQVQSLTGMTYPLKTPFGMTSLPVIHLEKPESYRADSLRIMQDDRFVHNLISADGTTLVVFIKTINSIGLEDAEALMAALDETVNEIGFEEYHYLGRPYFQRELVAMQKREIMVSAGISALLVTLILFLIFRKPLGVGLALVSIGLGMLLFIGYMGLAGREFNAMSALYPILMIIVGTSDVIHIMTKYVDELRAGMSRGLAIRKTIKEIGMATLLTSVTTAIGFATLSTSRIQPIRDFGINSAVGVLIAYFTVVLFTTALLSWLRTDQIMRLRGDKLRWEGWLSLTNRFTRRQPRLIALGGVAVLVLSLVGISRITTNYSIIKNMPRGEKITEDFTFFERQLSGFRPLEFAVFVQEGHELSDFEVIREVEKVEQYVRSKPYLQAVASVTGIYKSIHQMHRNNRADAYELPQEKATFARYRRLMERVPKQTASVLVSKDGRKTRITSRINDIGADSIKAFGEQFDRWYEANVDTSLIQVVRTGTGLIVDKNAAYIRRNLLQGLGLAVVIVSILMALLFRNWRMLLISLVPNLLPLLMAGAFLGYFGIELEAGVAIVFAVVFGIAVDDTIHFLSKFKLSLAKGLSLEDAIERTFVETGKAIVLTSVVLFFGFLVMLFSIHPPSVIVGVLISLTLLSAVVSDLLLIPVLIRWMMPESGAPGPKANTPLPESSVQSSGSSRASSSSSSSSKDL